MATRTKWEVMQAELEALQAKALKLSVTMDAINHTVFGKPCSACGLILDTEGDFARHFLIPDERYLGLGYCPRQEGR